MRSQITDPIRDNRRPSAIQVLLVDDEQGFRDAVARRLSRRGMTVSHADSGEACIEALEQDSVDVVVLDVRMPGMDGIDTLKILRRRHPGVQVILLTGNAAVADGVAGIRAGAFDYLTKPVEMDHLANKIRQAVERTRLETEKRRQAAWREKLEKKMVDTDRLAALGTLSTGIAHEINNPLAIIHEAAGFMTQVLSAPESAGLFRRDDLMMALEKITTGVRRARKITHQLLGHVKPQGARRVPLDLCRLVAETLALVGGSLREKQVEIVWAGRKKDHDMMGDPGQIRQVVLNLLTNAVHALDRGGRITITISGSVEETRLEIRDNGCGIPADQLGRVFDPFFTTKPQDQGTGLGLFVVHKIVTDMGGDITVDSRPGGGTAVTVTLPPPDIPPDSDDGSPDEDPSLHSTETPITRSLK